MEATVWSIKFPFTGQVDEKSLNSLLPVGTRTEATDNDRFVVIMDSYPPRKVGDICAAEGAVIIRFYTDIHEGSVFATGFGLRHPHYNPGQILFGFVYRTPSGLFQLDKMPSVLRSEVISQMGNYDTAGNVYFVSFYRGDWDTEFLTVATIQKVLPRGELGFDLAPVTLHLGNIENERTM